LPIPRRDARAGEWVSATHQRSRTRPQRPERPDGSESLSVTGTGNSDEHSVKTVCEERGECSRRRGGDDEAWWRQRIRIRKRNAGARCEWSGMEEHRTTGGADGDEAEGALCPVIGTIQLPGRRPRGGGRSPSFSVTKRRMNGGLSFPGNQGFTFTLLLLIV
jgi:hypothetical protein